MGAVLYDKESLRNLLEHLEEEHGKGNISDKTYVELKTNYENALNDIVNMPNEVNRLKIDLRTVPPQNYGDSIEREQIEQGGVPLQPEADIKPAFGKIFENFRKTRLKRAEDKPAEKIAKQNLEIVQERNEDRPEPPKEVPTEKAETDAAEISPEIEEESNQKAAMTEHANVSLEPKKANELGIIKRIFHLPKAKKKGTTDPIQPASEQPESLPEPPQLQEPVAIQVQEQQQVQEQPALPLQEEKAPAQPSIDYGVEIEKIKALLDAMRETKRATDETIANLFESLGEIRTMSFQTDASLKELTLKMERFEDQINDINPANYTKKINEINSELEKHNMFLEKLDTKTTDLSEKINQTYTLLKAIGGIENLINLNKDLQKKINDINEVVKYIERISVKAEKSYIDLNDRLSEFLLYKSKQDSLDENVKDILKALDRINVGLENYVQKKDLDAAKAEIMVLEKQAQDLTRALPLIETKLPENIAEMKNEREDIYIFLKSLEEQMTTGKIALSEYQEIKRKNEHKLAELDKKLAEKWNELLAYIEKTKGEEEKKEQQQEPEEVKEQKKEEKVKAEA
jgi:hypothetical protein